MASLTYAEWVEKMKQETHNEHNIAEWHRAGYLGQGVKVLNLEGYSGHGKTTFDNIVRTAPEAKVDWCQIGFGLKADKLYHFNAETADRTFTLEDLEDFADFLKGYDIITVSKSSSYGPELEEVFSESGAILISSAGNDDFDGVTGRFKDIGFSIGAVEMRAGGVHRESYSAVGEKLDFVCFHYEREGTSFSAPTFAGIDAIVLSKYPTVNKYEMYEVMKSICVDLGEQGFDEHFGHGLPVLPEDVKIELLEKEPEPQPEPEKVKQWTCRILHNSSNFDWQPGDTIKKGEKVCRMGSTGTDLIHAHIDAVKGLVKQYSLMDIERDLYMPLKAKIESLIVWGLFQYKPVITCEYLCENYMQDQKVSYNHWAIDVVPENRKITAENYDIYWPLDTPAVVMNVGTYSDGTKYIVLGVDETMEYKDVPKDKWYYEEVDWVSNEGLMTGYKDGTFRPDEPITRAEVAQILYNLKHQQ